MIWMSSQIFRVSRICLTLCLCLTNFFTGLNAKQNSIFVDLQTDRTSQIITVSKNCSLIINAVNISSSASVLMYQAHSQVENVTISEQPKALIHNSVTGRNIGLSVKLQNSETEKQIWLSNLSPRDVQVLIEVSSLDSFGPIPGGCNMEFPVEIAPYIKLKSDTMRLYLEYQHASFGFQRNEPHEKCSLSSPYISYEVYILFIEENNFGENEYFKKVGYMSKVSSIKEHSTKAMSYSLHPDTRYSFLMYPNLGVVYNVIAKYTVNNEVKEAAYIPVVTYGCSSSEFTNYGCNIQYSIKGKIFLFILSIYGFIVAFFGHSIFGAVLLFFGLLASFLVAFILIGKYLPLSKNRTADLSMILGFVGGLLFLSLGLWLRHPLVLLLLSGPVFGFLLTATVFYTPVGNFEIFVNENNFWSLLCSGVLFITVVTLLVPKLMTIMASSIIGSYMMLVFYDDFVGTRLSYIVLNIIKRAVSRKIMFASNDLPFQRNDIIMSTIWVILSVLAVTSWYKKPLFHSNRSTYSYSYFQEQSNIRGRSRQIRTASENDSVYQPFLRQNNNVSYQTF